MKTSMQILISIALLAIGAGLGVAGTTIYSRIGAPITVEDCVLTHANGSNPYLSKVILQACERKYPWGTNVNAVAGTAKPDWMKSAQWADTPSSSASAPKK